MSTWSGGRGAGPSTSSTRTPNWRTTRGCWRSFVTLSPATRSNGCSTARTGAAMRVIAGSAKGVRLAPVPAGTRPMADRVREGLFSSLGDRVVDASVLDLFAGTGAVGIEALSRGARRAVFVDSAPGAVKAIHENLRRSKFQAKAAVRRLDTLAAV